MEYHEDVLAEPPSTPAVPAATPASAALRSLADLSPWWTLAAGAPILIAQMAVFRWDRALHDRLFYSESSIIEIVTTLAPLAAALVCGWAALQGAPPIVRNLRWVFALLALGSLYFGGEEASWGQHYFHFETPDGWAQANYQRETNLHNLDQFRILDNVPRNLLAAGIIVGSVIWPLWSWARRIRPTIQDKLYWLMPGPACWPLGWLSMAPQLQKRLGLGWIHDPGETEEMYFALFLLVYALSIAYRLLQIRRGFPPGRLEPSADANG